MDRSIEGRVPRRQGCLAEVLLKGKEAAVQIDSLGLVAYQAYSPPGAELP